MNRFPSPLQISFLVFALLFSFNPTARVFASDSALFEQDVADYVEFDDDTWWEYEITNVSYGGKISYRSVEIDNDGTGSTGYVEDNIYYLSEYKGESFDEPYVAFDLEGYSQEISEDAYLAYGINEEEWGEVGDVTHSCEYTLESDQSVEMDDGEAYEGTGILAECSLEFKILEAVEGLSSRGLEQSNW